MATVAMWRAMRGRWNGLMRALAAFLARLRPGDLAIFTADHGNDPTWRGTEHTRERVPVLWQVQASGKIGICGFTDVAASIAAHLGVPTAVKGGTFYD